MIRFACSKCGRHISVDEKYSGKKGKCPKCGNVLVVPEISTIIVFECESCGHEIKVSEKHAGKSGKCPQCGGEVDPGLRAELESLLRAHEKAGSFLQKPVVDPNVTLDQDPLTEVAGTVIGSYKLLEQVGEGGMAVVYMAEQEKPVRRRVALKIIKLGMDSKQVIARFEAERQALALMDHPNIAKVFDAGTTDTGRPYFVMELVRGVKAGKYIKSAKLHIRLIDIRLSKIEPSQVNASEGETFQGAALRIATELCERIRDGEDFGELARAHSHGHRQSYGGQWDPFTPGSLAREYAILDEHAQQMQLGQVSEPIQKGGHVFILKLEQRQEEEITPFEEVKDSLKEELRTLKRRRLEEVLEEADR